MVIVHVRDRSLFSREQSFFFRKDHLNATQKFYEKHGGKTIILARFMPFARTFAPVVAGVGRMPYRRFLAFNAAGGLIWAVGFTLLGYLVGASYRAVENIAGTASEAILGVIVLVVVVFVIRRWRRERDPRPPADSG